MLVKTSCWDSQISTSVCHCFSTQLLFFVFVQHATGYSKLEKADILELAVKYMRNIRGQQISGIVINFLNSLLLISFIQTTAAKWDGPIINKKDNNAHIVLTVALKLRKLSKLMFNFHLIRTLSWLFCVLHYTRIYCVTCMCFKFYMNMCDMNIFISPKSAALILLTLQCYTRQNQKHYACVYEIVTCIVHIIYNYCFSYLLPILNAG